MIVKCGCGKHYVKEESKTTVMWQDGHWAAQCAFNALQVQNEYTYRRLCRKIEILHKVVEQLKCTLCGHPLGTHYKEFGDGLYHCYCLYDVGGEG